MNALSFDQHAESLPAIWRGDLLCWAQLPDGRVAGVLPRWYNTQILIGLDEVGYADAY
jgi:hypothetical protein